MDKLIFSITISTLCFLFNYSSYRDLVQQQQCATSLNHHSIQYDCDSHTQASPVVKKQTTTTTTLNRAGEPWFSWWSPNIEKKNALLYWLCVVVVDFCQYVWIYCGICLKFNSLNWSIDDQSIDIHLSLWSIFGSFFHNFKKAFSKIWKS